MAISDMAEIQNTTTRNRIFIRAFSCFLVGEESCIGGDSLLLESKHPQVSSVSVNDTRRKICPREKNPDIIRELIAIINCKVDALELYSFFGTGPVCYICH